MRLICDSGLPWTWLNRTARFTILASSRRTSAYPCERIPLATPQMSGSIMFSISTGVGEAGNAGRLVVPAIGDDAPAIVAAAYTVRETWWDRVYVIGRSHR